MFVSNSLSNLITINLHVCLSYHSAFASVDTTIIKKQFLKKQLNYDVSYLAATIERMHPNMYHSISRQA